MDDACAVCAEPLRWVAYGACGHREVCSVCVARLRFVLHDRRCCLCMTPCPSVFVTKAMGDRTRVIADFSALPAAAAEGKVGEYWHHEGTGAWFDDADHYSAVRAMCRLSCSTCDAAAGDQGKMVAKAKRQSMFQSIELLKAHLFSQHRLYMCDLCLEGRKVFLREQKLYTRSQLDQHIKTGDLKVDGSAVERCGFAGHPMCKFCKTPFYGDNELYTHMTREHYTCHLCERQDNRNYDYFRNYDDLEMHFRIDHVLCEDEGCLEKKFIVFQSEAELKKHNAVEHQERMSHAEKNAALQIPTSFGDWSEQDHYHRRGREHNVHSTGAVNNIARSGQHGMGIQVDSVAAPLQLLTICSSSVQSSEVGQSSGISSVFQQSCFSPTSCQEAPDARTGSILQGASFPSISEQSRYSPPLSRSSRNAARIEDEAFPPLSATTNRVAALTPQGLRKIAENTTSGLRQHRKGTVKSNHSAQSLSLENTGPNPSCPNASQSWPTPTPISAISGSLSLASGGNGRPEPLVSSHTLGIAEDVRAANKSLVERMRAALGMDQDRFSTFKKISGKYRQGAMNTSDYLSHVEQFGLSHLVLEMARLLPDPQKQKELADAYYASLRLASLQENGGGTASGLKEDSQKKNKGKCKIPNASETTGAAKYSVEGKSVIAASKLQPNGAPQGGGSRVVLTEGRGAADHADGSSKVQQLGLPGKGAWQNRGGQRLIVRNSKKGHMHIRHYTKQTSETPMVSWGLKIRSVLCGRVCFAYWLYILHVAMWGGGR